MLAAPHSWFHTRPVSGLFKIFIPAPGRSHLVTTLQDSSNTKHATPPRPQAHALGGVHGSAVKMLRRLEREVKDGARDGTVYGRSLTAAKGFTSHWLRLISTSIAGSVATSFSQWGDYAARNLLDAADVIGANAGAA